MKKITYHIVFLIALMSLCACDAFLDVKPEDKLTQEQVRSAETAINSVLNGIYVNMTKEALYGANLTKSTMDVLAQNYSLGTDHRWLDYASLKYDEGNVQSTFDGIWKEAYKQVLDINEFFNILEKTTISIPESRKNILLGEAYALRAFQHFDILRLFCPVYSVDSTTAYITYNDAPGAVIRDPLPTNEIMDKIIADLQKAEELLQNDPIITSGVVTASTNDPIGDFYINRNYRLNYYAVKALQARVWLWRGNKAAALAAAKTVIAAQTEKKYFKWTPYADISRSKNPDRIFSTEIIFGIENRGFGYGRSDMYSLQDGLFSVVLDENSRLFVRNNRLFGNSSSWFDNTNDYRYAYLWTAGGTGMIFVKYNKPTKLDEINFGYFQPLIRIAEMYYIAAECEPVTADGLRYLNEFVRPQRGLTAALNVSTAAELNAELQKEYRREFFGEGQLFFYYKRMNLPAIPDAMDDNATKPMTPEKYQLNIPLSEQF